METLNFHQHHNMEDPESTAHGYKAMFSLFIYFFIYFPKSQKQYKACCMEAIIIYVQGLSKIVNKKDTTLKYKEERVCWSQKGLEFSLGSISLLFQELGYLFSLQGLTMWCCMSSG